MKIDRSIIDEILFFLSIIKDYSLFQYVYYLKIILFSHNASSFFSVRNKKFLIDKQQSLIKQSLLLVLSIFIGYIIILSTFHSFIISSCLAVFCSVVLTLTYPILSPIFFTCLFLSNKLYFILQFQKIYFPNYKVYIYMVSVF